jgi:hypothetical protein
MEEKMRTHNNRVPWLLYPFWLIWRFVVWILQGTGRLIGAILGLVLIIVGVILSITIVGAIIGVPLIIFGVMLIGRSLF